MNIRVCIMSFCSINRLLDTGSEDRPSLECRRSVPSTNPGDRAPKSKPEYTSLEKEKWNGCSERGKRTLDLRIRGEKIEDDKREDKSLVGVV